MGLDTSHGCWHGPYGAFMRWRMELARVAGLPMLDLMEGFGGSVKWEALIPDPLHILLRHSDCDGAIAWQDCAAIAARLTALLALIEAPGYRSDTRQFIDGLMRAHAARENVDFY